MQFWKGEVQCFWLVKKRPFRLFLAIFGTSAIYGIDGKMMMKMMEEYEEENDDEEDEEEDDDEEDNNEDDEEDHHQLHLFFFIVIILFPFHPVIFKNRNANDKKSLAWCCVQLHCEEYKSESEKSKRQKHSHQSTAITKSKQTIFSSDPLILFCDLTLEPGKSEKFESTHRIPLHQFPPTFKGHYVKYLWHISVGAQQVDAPIKMIQLPIKVLNVGVDVNNDDGQQMKKASTSNNRNPILTGNETKTKPSIIEIAIGRVEEICSVRKKRFYEINNGGIIFAKIIIFKNTFKLGDDVLGKLEFPQEDVHCLQTLIRAETVETNLTDDQKLENVQSHSTEHNVTAFVKETYFKIPIPLNVVPSFTTEFVKVRWRLHFEFVTTHQMLMNNSAGQGTFKLAEDLQIETMKWDLPINILATNPLNVSLVYPISHPNSFII